MASDPEHPPGARRLRARADPARRLRSSSGRAGPARRRRRRVPRLRVIRRRPTGRYAGPSGARATRMPGYPLFLAALETVAGPSTRLVQWTQCLLGALTCLFVFLWARSLLRPPWALFVRPRRGLLLRSHRSVELDAHGMSLQLRLGRVVLGSFPGVSSGPSPRAPRRLVFRAHVFGPAGSPPVRRPDPGRVAVPAERLRAEARGRRPRGFPRGRLALGRTQRAGLPPIHPGQHRRRLQRLLRAAPSSGPSRARSRPYALALGRRRTRAGRGLPARLSSSCARSVPVARRAKAYLFNLLTVYYPFLPRYDWTYALLVPFWIFGLRPARARRELWPPAGLVAGLSVVFAFLAGPRVALSLRLFSLPDSARGRRRARPAGPDARLAPVLLDYGGVGGGERRDLAGGRGTAARGARAQGPLLGLKVSARPAGALPSKRAADPNSRC